MNAVKKAIFGVMAGAVIVATVAGSSVFGTHVPVRQPAEPAGDLVIEQSETSGVSLSAEVQPTAANATAIGTQRVTATVEPASAIYDLEWSLSVDDSRSLNASFSAYLPLIENENISDYLSITQVSDNAIDIVCYKCFDGYATLQVEDNYTGKTATADVSAWYFNRNQNFTYQYETDFSTNTTGQTSWTYYFRTNAGLPAMTYCFDGWYLRPGIMGTTTRPQYPTYDSVSDGTYGANDIEGAGVQLVYHETLASGATDYFVRYMPRFTDQGITYPYIQATSVAYLVAEIDASGRPTLYGVNSDYTLLGSWYQNGTYICMFVVKNGADVEGSMFGIGFSHDASHPRTSTYTLTSLKLYGTQIYIFDAA